MNRLQTVRLVIRSTFKDPFSGFSHLAGALLSVAGLVLLLMYAAQFATLKHLVTFTIFGAALILLYTASALYHLLRVPEKVNNWLRRVDHMMIYVLIAGTYTPVCILGLTGAWGLTLLVTVWVLAVAGIIMKIIWFGAPRWLSTGIYLAMGWLVVFAMFPLIHSLPVGALTWLVIGGLMYTIGAAIYGSKWPPLTCQWFGFHEIFHVFVLAGSMGHFWMMFRYLMYI